jgi:hypothetical protein
MMDDPDRGTHDASGASTLFLDQLQGLLAHRIPLLVLYGEQEDLWREFEDARSGRLGQLLDEGADRIELVTLAGNVHGFTNVANQDAVVEHTERWLADVATGLRGAPVGNA